MSKKPAHPVDVHVGQRVREARLLAGLAQEKVGDKLGLTFQQLQKYENGTNRISASKLWLLSEILGRPVEWFFQGAPKNGEVGIMPTDDPMSRLAVIPGGVTLARAFARLDQEPELRRSIVNMVESVASYTAGEPG
jgi:transcriptional regulator with XRE-family HTH domain